MQKRSHIGTVVLSLCLISISCDSSENEPARVADEACVENSKNLYPQQTNSLYTLPYAVGASFNVTQGNCTTGSHRSELSQQFAYDFGMPSGTSILAVRAGLVVAAVESFSDNTGKAGQENFVSIMHSDSTVARYVHLTENGADVLVGESVTQGQRIGTSGNSGFSSGPHLHFDVIDGNCSPQSIACKSIPVIFLNTVAHPRGLEEGRSYEAQPY